MSSTSIQTSTSHSFIPPSPSALRSPCPALNALANHGYINRDGRNLTVHALVEVMQRVYNLTKPLAYLLAIAGVFLCGNGRTVDLDRLAKHNIIEHDASLSRQDAQPSDKYSPISADPDLVDRLMRLSPGPVLALNDFAVARVIRESQALGGPLDCLHAKIAKAESALILQVFGGENCEVDKNVLRVWFVDGRLCDNWIPPKKRIGIYTTSSIRRQIANVMASIRNPKPTPSAFLDSYYLAFRLGRELRLLAFGLVP